MKLVISLINERIKSLEMDIRIFSAKENYSKRIIDESSTEIKKLRKCKKLIEKHIMGIY